MTTIHDTADLVSKALRRAWQLGQTYWQQADSEYQSHWKKADATQDTFNQLVEDTRAAILAAHSSARPAPSVPREAIDKMLTQLMDIAVSNGANSISMPDEYVEVAAWLCGIPAQLAPTIAEQDQINAEAAIRSIYGAQPAPIEMSITTGALSEMFLSLDGHDKAQPGYEWRKGWNDAIRQAMEYAQPAPSAPEVTDAMALAFHSALTDGSIGEHEMEEIKAGLRAALAAAPEAKP